MQKGNKLRKFIPIVLIIAILVIVGIILVSRKSDVVNLAKTDEEEIKAITSADGKWEYTVTNSTNKTIRVDYYNADQIANVVSVPSIIDGYTVTSLDTTMLWGKGCVGSRYITDITIPSTVTDVKDGMGWNPSELQSITVDSNNPSFTSVDGVLYNKDMTELVCCPQKKTSINIPSSVTSIGNHSFSWSSITSIDIPSSVTSVEESAFSYCTATTINIPSSVTSIGSYAFSDCRNLTSIDIPSAITNIGYDTFKNCSSLTSINIPSSVTSIESNAFENCTSLTSINIPSSVTNLGYNVFRGCSGLTNVEISSSITRIDSSTFEGCSSLTNVEIPSSVTNISNSAFKNCTSLTSIKIPETVTWIEDSAFVGDTNLTIYCYPYTTAYWYAVRNSIKYEKIGISSVIIKTNPTKMSYVQTFEDLDLTGGVLEIRYEDNYVTTISMRGLGVTTSGFSNSTVGTVPVTITYEGKSVILNVTVVAKTLSGISVKTNPTKMNYMQGLENLDLTGGELTLTYNNNNSFTETISMTASGVTTSGFSNSTAGTKPVTITYGGKSTTLNVTVTAKTLREISIKTNPTKTSYKKGESLDLTGGIITLKYDNNTTDEIAMTSSEVIVTGFSNTSLGKKELTVEYGNKTTTFQVEIIGDFNYKPTPDGSGIIITGGEEGNPDIVIPGEINGKPVTEIGPGAFKDRDDLESIEIPDSVTNIADDAFEGSEDTIIICNPGSKAEEFAKDHDMSYIYKDKIITGISVKTPPTKTTYKKDSENLDLTGGRLTVSYEDEGLTSVLRMTSKGITATGFDNTEIGIKPITVSYEGKSATFEVTVEETLSVLLGDISGDGVVDSTDLLLMKRHIIAGSKTEWILTGDKFTRGDMNLDGTIDSTDLLQLKRKIVNNR